MVLQSKAGIGPFQAILPLRGKILNVERARLDKLLSSKEIKSLIIALGAAIADELDIEKLRYHRIVIMTDADVDGAHIRTLLLTLFYRYYREVIEKGYLYIAQPPLYKVQKGRSFEYAYTEHEKEEVIERLKNRSTKDTKKAQQAEQEEEQQENEEQAEEQEEQQSATPQPENKVPGIRLQRYKGLGEMNPVQLWDTTMNPQNRLMFQVELEDAKEADTIFEILMGSEVAPRKRFIQTHADKVQNLDV